MPNRSTLDRDEKLIGIIWTLWAVVALLCAALQAQTPFVVAAVGGTVVMLGSLVYLEVRYRVFTDNLQATWARYKAKTLRHKLTVLVMVSIVIVAVPKVIDLLN